MTHQPIKISDNFSLYSGDVITLNNSNPLLVEVINNQSIKLRRIDKNKYLAYKKLTFDKSALDFSTKFEKALIFIIKANEQGEISLKLSNEHLKTNKKDFHLSAEEKWLIINKQKNTEKIADYEEIIKVNKEEIKEESNEEIIIHHFYDNQSNTISKQNFKFSEIRQEEQNITCSSSFTWGCSINFKTELCSALGIEISGQFENSSETSDSLTKTKIRTFEEAIDIDCEPWKKTTFKLIAKKVREVTPYTAVVKRIIGNNDYEYLVKGEYSQSSYTENRKIKRIADTRNILLVGWTGSGKSTLAKVLSGDNKFESSDGSVSKTRSFKKSEEFEYQGNHYCVIDNIGFDDTKLDNKEVLLEIGQAISSAREGLSHVLLVFDGKFTDRVKEDFDKLIALKITNSYVSLIRSKFVNFGTKKECEEDRKKLESESPEINRLIDRCQGFLYINNNEDDERSCNKSRKRILDHLHKNCKNDPFKPKEWDDITSLIEKYLKDKEVLELEVNTTGQEKETEEKIDNLKNNTANQVKEKTQGEEIKEFIGLIEVGNKGTK